MTQPRAIRLLSPELQNQIAAGEVVERPASVLKELMENSLDARATRIRVQINDGGQSLIRVSDNGYGIPADQLELAVTRHATSKLARLQDLQEIRSFGFRGEAIPSIASVSRFRLQSAQADGEGAFLDVLHGRMTGTGAVSMPRGTEVEVRDLFANIPARLKFLKQPATESRKCLELILRLVLIHLDVEFEALNAERTVYHFPGGQTLSQRLGAVWPDSVLEKIHPLDATEADIHVHGLIGDPATAQARADKIYIYVNGRPVQDKIVQSALREACKSRMLGKEYPQAVLFLDLPPQEVDVNVHPAKTEVRFQDEGRVFRAVRNAVTRTLDHLPGQNAGAYPARSISIAEARPVLPNVRPGRTYLAEAEPNYAPIPDKFASTSAVQALFPDPWPRSLPQTSNAPAGTDWTPEQTSQTDLAEQINAPTVPEPASQRCPAPGPTSGPGQIQYLGQFAQTYLILAAQNEIILIDQHAAHERVLFNMLRAQATNGEKHPLLLPLELPMHPAQAEQIQDIWADLGALGFSLEISPDSRLLIKAVPALLPPAAARQFVHDVLTGKARSMEDLWTLMACKSAVKAGDSLSPDEALSLVAAWQALPDKNYCPHGRPASIRWQVSDLEKMFKRRA